MAVTESGHLASREVDDLYRRHGAEVYRYAYAVLGNHADAEDVTQTTFLNAYRALEQGVRPRKPSNWLLAIASNAIKQRFRQELTRPRTVELDESLAGHDVEEDVETPSVGELLTALSKIPPQQRQAIVLREFEGRSYAEIAEILGVTTAALETLLFRARRSLAEELEHRLTCTDAQLAVSRAADGRLGRKERRRLKDHLAECPDCAHFARLQKRHSRALRGLVLIPIPLSLSVLKGLEGAGTASAATLHLVPGGGAAASGVTTTASGTGVGLGTASSTASGGFFAGGVAVKAAAAVVAVTVASGAAVTGALEIRESTSAKSTAAAVTGKRLGQAAGQGKPSPRKTVASKPSVPRAGTTSLATTPSSRVSRTPKTLAGGVNHATTTQQGYGPGHTTNPGETTPPEQTAPPEPTASPPERTASPPTQTSPTKPTAKPKRTNKGKRIAGAKRANTTKSHPAQPTTAQTPATGKANGADNGNANGADNGNSSQPAAGRPTTSGKP